MVFEIIRGLAWEAKDVNGPAAAIMLLFRKIPILFSREAQAAVEKLSLIRVAGHVGAWIVPVPAARFEPNGVATLNLCFRIGGVKASVHGIDRLYVE